MKKNIALSLIFFISFSFLYSMGFSTKSKIIFLEDSEYTPDCVFENSTSFFLSLNFQNSNFAFSISPSLLFYNENIYLNIYKMNMSLFFNNFAFSFAKQNIYFGEGQIYNALLPLGIEQFEKEKNLWFMKGDFLFSNFSLSFASLIDNNIDFYKKPKYINPFILFSYNNIYFNLTTCVDSIIYFENEKNKTKCAMQMQFLLPKDFTFYATGNCIFDFNKSASFSAVSGLYKYFYLYNNLIIPYIEAAFYNDKLCIGSFINFETNTLVSALAGIKYTIENDIRFFCKADIYIEDFSLSFSFNSGDLQTKNILQNAIFSLGVKYEN